MIDWTVSVVIMEVFMKGQAFEKKRSVRFRDDGFVFVFTKLFSLSLTLLKRPAGVHCTELAWEIIPVLRAMCCSGKATT